MDGSRLYDIQSEGVDILLCFFGFSRFEDQSRHWLMTYTTTQTRSEKNPQERANSTSRPQQRLVCDHLLGNHLVVNYFLYRGGLKQGPASTNRRMVETPQFRPSKSAIPTADDVSPLPSRRPILKDNSSQLICCRTVNRNHTHACQRMYHDNY